MRNSWLTLEKNAVLARSISASTSARSALRLECAHIRNACGDMAGYKFEEAAIAIIQNATRAHARNQKAGWSLLGSCE